MDGAMEKIVTILVAIIGLATLVALIAPKSRTSEVITSGGNAFSKILGTALAPISGGGGIGGVGFNSPF